MSEQQPTRLNPDKAPTTPVVAVIVGGVRVSSRYQKRVEIECMTHAIAAMPEGMPEAIAGFWCDSKATHTYSVEMRPGFDRQEVTRPIAEWLGRWMRTKHGGHNGIFVGQHGEGADPEWDESGEE
jgi:hypothetical protein